MKPVNFTQHALEKLSLLEASGFPIDRQYVIECVRRPDQALLGYSGRLIAQAVFDGEHVVRVVYEDNEVILVITVYPGRRQRYGD